MFNLTRPREDQPLVSLDRDLFSVMKAVFYTNRVTVMVTVQQVADWGHCSSQLVC